MTLTPVRPDSGIDRRARIVEVATALAADGGYDAVQMRVVAQRCPVAIATLYRHFPSKIHLLVSVMRAELDRIQDRIDRMILRGQSPYDRLMTVVGALTRSMQRAPRLSEATTRALMSADRSVAGDVSSVRESLDEMFARAMGHGDPTPQQHAVGRVIGDVWLANMVAWVGGRETGDEVVDRLAHSIALVLGQQRAEDLF